MKKGNNTISSVYKGRTAIDKIYKGLMIVYEAFKDLLVSGIPPLTLLKSTGKDLVDYKIYGNSVQNGEPTPTNPVKIESVGDKTKNLLDNDELLLNHHYNNVTGALTKGEGRIATPKINVENIDTITIKYSRKKTTNTCFLAWDKDGTMIERDANKLAYNVTSLTIDVTNSYEIAFFWWASATLVEGDIYDVMICEGSEILDYESYGYKVTVNASGKNKFHTKNLAEKINNNTEIKGDTIILTPLSNSLVRTTFKIPVKKNTNYSVSFIFEMINSEDYKNGACRFFIRSDTGYLATKGLNAISSEQKINMSFNSGEFDEVGIWLYFNTLQDGTQDIGNSYGIYKNIQIQEGDTSTDYEPYVDPITHNIYLKEPLRKIGDYVGYIDFKNSKVVRNVEVIDNTGTLILEESLKGLITPIEETIELPNIPTLKGTTILSVDTEIQPSNAEVIYKGK